MPPCSEVVDRVYVYHVKRYLGLSSLGLIQHILGVIRSKVTSIYASLEHGSRPHGHNVAALPQSIAA